MGQFQPRHARVDDELGQLAGRVLARIHVGRGDRATVDDCYQTAYIAGLEAQRSAARAHSHTSAKFLMLAMQSAVFRLLRHRSRRIALEADLAC